MISLPQTQANQASPAPENNARDYSSHTSPRHIQCLELPVTQQGHFYSATFHVVFIFPQKSTSNLTRRVFVELQFALNATSKGSLTRLNSSVSSVCRSRHTFVHLGKHKDGHKPQKTLSL